jgi:hypothetical protein
MKQIRDRLTLISAELKRSNALAEIRLKLDQPQWAKSGRTSGAPKVVSLNHPTVESWNENYRKTHAEDIEPEEG